MVHYCSVPQCGGKWRRGGKHLRFHAFPKNEDMRKLWQTSIQRTQPPSQSAKVCSKHFKENDYITAPSGYKYLMKSAIPSLYLPERISAHSIPLGSDASPLSMDYYINVEALSTSEDCLEEPDVKNEVKFSPGAEVMSQYTLNSPSQEFDRSIGFPLLSCSSLTNDELNYFSGLSKFCFEKFLSSLTVQPFTLPACALSAENQLLLTLCKMKHNFSFGYLSIVFKVEPNDAFIVFSFWTYTMYRVLKSMCFTSGKGERGLLGSLSIGIVQVKILKQYTSCIQKVLTYPKVSTFLKGVVAVDDCKLSMYYCSKLYDDRTSTDVMLQDSGLKMSLRVGSCIVADESLLVCNYFENMNVKVKPVQVSHCVCGHDEITQFQASKYVMNSKCFQCLVELYHILADGIAPNLTIMQSEIFFNCMMILNLREDLFMSS